MLKIVSFPERYFSLAQIFPFSFQVLALVAVLSESGHKSEQKVRRFNVTNGSCRGKSITEEDVLVFHIKPHVATEFFLIFCISLQKISRLHDYDQFHSNYE
jgi:hypothetical protein